MDLADYSRSWNRGVIQCDLYLEITLSAVLKIDFREIEGREGSKDETK